MVIFLVVFIDELELIELKMMKMMFNILAKTWKDQFNRTFEINVNVSIEMQLRSTLMLIELMLIALNRMIASFKKVSQCRCRARAPTAVPLESSSGVRKSMQ